MVLQPIGPKPCPTVHYNARPNALPVWSAIAERQKQCAEAWWLIAQPDHANLSGDLAANFVSEHFPRITADIAKAVALHDSGWSMFVPERDPAAEPMIGDDWKPRSFVEFPPNDFLRAWTGSIERATEVCAAGGVMVSRHFCALGQSRLKGNFDDEAGTQLVRDFLGREAERQQQLSSEAGITAEESDGLLKVLQFCDLLSLYLCSGATEDVEFPQKFGGEPVRLAHTQDFCVLEPSPFQRSTGAKRSVSLGVPARRYPVNGTPQITTLPFLLE